MAMMTSGIAVATTQDLNQALSTIDTRLEDHKKWTENHIAEFIVKLRQNTERIETCEREQHSSLENITANLKSLQSGTVSNMLFRQHMNQIEKRFDQSRDEAESRLEMLKTAMEKEITSSVGNLRLKAETLNANCIALTEKCKVLEETLLPSLRADVEEQKQKRLGETQRLESELEKMKEICEQKISHTAAALRFYVTATATKLQEELAPMTMAKEIEEDLKQKEKELKKNIKASEELVATLRDQLVKHKEELDTTCDHYTNEINQHSKALKIVDVTLQNLQTGVGSDLNDMREQIRTDRVNLQTEMNEARASAARAAKANDNAIESVAKEINPLRQFRELILERLHIEKTVQQVQEWQSGHVPQITSVVKDLEERVKRVQLTTQKDHDLIMELKTGHSAIRGHFKMFHAIAAGLDEKPMPGEAGMDTSHSLDTRLPGSGILPPIETSPGRNIMDIGA